MDRDLYSVNLSSGVNKAILNHEGTVPISDTSHFTIDEFESEFSTKHFPQVIHDNQDGRKHIGGAAEVAAYFKENNIAVPAK